MQWEGREESSNVQDRRGMSPKMAIGGGAGLIVAIIAFFLGVDPGNMIRQNQGVHDSPGDGETGEIHESHSERHGNCVGRRISKTESAAAIQEPTLVLFNDEVDSACGRARLGGWAVLLSRRQQHLYRPRLLSTRSNAT